MVGQHREQLGRTLDLGEVSAEGAGTLAIKPIGQRFVFKGTIASNIRLHDETIDDAQISRLAVSDLAVREGRTIVRLTT